MTDWKSTYASNSSTSEVTLESLKKTMKEIDEQALDFPKPGAYFISQSAMNSLKVMNPVDMKLDWAADALEADNMES